MKRIALVAVMTVSVLLVAPVAAHAAIHEIIGAACRAGGEEVVPPGQVAGVGNAFLAALRGTGVIQSIDDSVPGQVTVTFDLSKPASKFMSAGFDLTIPDGLGPGVDLILSPLPLLDPSFAAHANCKNLNA